MATTRTREKVTDVQSLDPYTFFAVLGKQVIHPGGRKSTEEISGSQASSGISKSSTWDAASLRPRSRWRSAST